MPPKRMPKMPSVYESWAKQEAAETARQQKAKPYAPGELVDLIDIECSQEAPKPKKWDPLSMTNFSPVASTSCVANYVSEENLNEFGYDSEAGKCIAYPIGEFIRPYEQILLRKCLSINTCISLPLGVSPAHIVALTFLNFSRWFPNSLLVGCCNSNEASEALKNACVAVGFNEKKVTIFTNYQQFKKKQSHVGKVLITTAQCIQKIVESDSTIISTLRCIAVNLEPNEQLAKYTKFVGPLIGKGISFRLLTTVPSFPDGSRRSSSISKRQQMITSLFISDWEEPRSSEPAFRLAAVPTGLQTVYWSESDQYNTNLELLQDWKEGFNQFIKDFPFAINLPSQEIEELINIDWREIQKQAREISSVVVEQCNIASFLVTAYRNLLLSGIRVFYLYCKDILNQENNGTLSEQIQVAILGSESLSKVFYKVQSEFSYNADSIANATFNNKSASSHIIYPMLINEIEEFSKHGIMRGAIVCESLNLARTVAESISTVPNCTIILGVPSTMNIPSEYQSNARHFNRMTGIFFEPKNVIVVYSFEEEAALAALDTGCSNKLTFIIAIGRRSISLAEYHSGEYKAILNDKYEHLRESDGKTVQEAVEPQVKRWSTGAIGAVNKYSFKFEPSKLALDIRRKRVEFIRTLEPVPGDNTAEPQETNINEAESKKEKKPRKRRSAKNIDDLPLIGVTEPRQKRNVEESEVVATPPARGRKKKEQQKPTEIVTVPSNDDITEESNEIPTKVADDKENVQDNKLIVAYDRILGKLDTLLSM